MDQDLHGKMVADVYLTLFSYHCALVTAPSTAICLLQLKAEVAVLRSLRITFLTGIMAGSELPHRYVGACHKAPGKDRVLSGPLQPLLEQ
jgi:hypothetical protein